MALPIRWLSKLADANQGEFRLGRSGDDVIAEWVGCLTLKSNLSGTTTSFSFDEAIDRHAVETRLAAKVAALLGHLRGELWLHASGVARAGCALVFVGDSCAGKSTIAAQLCLEPEVELVSDDLCCVNYDDQGVSVLPNGRGHLLRNDVASALGLDPRGRSKTWKPAERALSVPARLRALVALIFDDAIGKPVLRRVHGARAFVALNRALVRFAIDEPAILRRDMDRLARIADEVSYYELVRSRDLNNLRASAQEAALLLKSLRNDRPGERS